jgi:hypothetical protein
MRSTEWILAAVVVGCTSVAAVGQPCGYQCGGCWAGWGPLSGEPCCSPPAYSVSAWRGPCCCWANPQPCCNNAWDGYCTHHARAQAFWAQVGVPKTRCCYPCVTPRMQGGVSEACPEGSAPIAQSTPSPAAVAPAGPAPNAQPAPSHTPIPDSSNAAPSHPAPPATNPPSARPARPAAPVPDSSREAPKPAVASGPAISTPPSGTPMPPDEAFREIGKPWIR